MIEIDFGNDYIDLDKIYDSGQVFRWEKIDDKEYRYPTELFFGETFINVKQKDNHTIVCDCEDDILSYDYFFYYFDVNTNYQSIYNRLIEMNAPQYLIDAASFSRGIRILHQDLWEVIVSFIISQNNNIPRIKKSIQALCNKYGHFPTSEDIIKKHILKGDSVSNCGLGYRENYIVEVAWQFFNFINFESDKPLRTYKDSMNLFLQWKGIGPKVANCICLYGLHRLEAFPRDTWIKKIEDKYFNGHFPDEQFPDCAGILQQYMFYYERNKNVKK